MGIRRVSLGLAIVTLLTATLLAQQTVHVIAPPAVGLPAEADSAGITKFSFIAYGDTRGQLNGEEQQPEHARIIDGMLQAIKTQAAAGFPVRFVVQSGDGVTNGGVVEQWNLRFTSLIEQLTLEGGVPFFFAVGNHDLGPQGVPEADRLRNAFTAMSRLWPEEGSPRRLDGYAAFAFGFGQYFFITLDSNIVNDTTQLAWVTRQLEGLDRRRYANVVAFFHHPPITSGSHGGETVVESNSEAMRKIYLPLFRRHHVRLLLAGHDHLLDHWVEHYEDEQGWHRMDQVVTGGGGAPTYVYRGEPDLARYVKTAEPQRVRIDHLAKPGWETSDNPHHFVVFDVDGDRLWIQVMATSPVPFRPYGSARVELVDP
jgi:3',5'-cyclic AMP phosphodiesterase CpdA